MKPAFALNLSHDGIGLLRRVADGWVLIGKASLEDPQLGKTLAGLRARATAAAPETPLTTKLVIPNSQILYTEVEAPGPAAANRRAAIRKALEGRTPYAVADLVFDWSGTGKVVQVAVVARETLAEAEAFAEEHDLAPVSFVGIPESGDFGGEPFFGPTARAAEFLPEGARMDRDQDPVRITAMDLPDDAADTLPDPVGITPESPLAAAADAEPGEEHDLSDVADLADIAAETDVLEVAGDADADAETDAETDAGIPVVATAEKPTIAEAPKAAPAPAAEPGPAMGTAGETAPAPEPEAEAEAPPAPPVVADVADDADDGAKEVAPSQPNAEVTKREPEIAPQETPAAGTEPAAPEDRSAPFVLTFSSRRVDSAHGKLAAAPRTLGPAVDLTGSETEPPRLGAARTGEPVPTEKAPISARRAGSDTPPKEEMAVADDGAVSAASPAVTDGFAIYRNHLSTLLAHMRKRLGREKPDPAAKPPEPLLSGASAHGAPDPKADTKPEVLVPPLETPLSGIGQAKPAARTPDAVLPKATPPTVPKAKGPEAEGTRTALTVFGARRRDEIGKGTPRYLGPMLILALVLFIAAVALWSSFLGIGTPDPVVTEAPAKTAAEPSVPAEIALAQPKPEPATEPEPVAVPAPAADTDVTLAAPTLPEATPPQPPAAPSDPTATGTERPTEAEIADRYAATGVWIGAPQPGVIPEQGTRSAIAPIRPDVASGAAAAPTIPAPDAFATRAAPAPASAPPPYEALLSLAVGGVIAPTPEGTITQDYVTLFAGKPPVVPPERPTVAPPEPEPDPLDGKTPRARPDGLVPEPPPETPAVTPAETPPETPAGTKDDAALAPEEVPEAIEPAPAADPALAGKQPLARPASVLAAASAAAQPPTEAEAAPPAFDGATGLAVASSRRPATRPRDFARAVDAAVATAISSAVQSADPDPEPAPARTAAAPAPAEDLDEPEPDAAAPDIPTRASVAKQATVTNAIKLNQVNLIGVFGSSSNRRALIRMGNGRFVKVQVGDRLDGGKVTGISDRKLTYVKNGKTLALEMPPEG